MHCQGSLYVSNFILVSDFFRYFILSNALKRCNSFIYSLINTTVVSGDGNEECTAGAF